MSALNREHQIALERIMSELKQLFPPQWKLTVLARNTQSQSADKDIMISEDQLDLACKALDTIRIMQLMSVTGIQLPSSVIKQ